MKMDKLQELTSPNSSLFKRRGRRRPRGEPRRVPAPLPDPDDDMSEEDSGSEESEEEEDDDLDSAFTSSNLSAEYWQIQKLIKYIKVGDVTATVLALCALRDFNLEQAICQLAIREAGGLEVLLNLLDSCRLRCQRGSLKILRQISLSAQIRAALADLGGVRSLVAMLREPFTDLRALAAETLANVARYRRAQPLIRRHGGIPLLVELLSVPEATLMTHADDLTWKDSQVLEAARCGALALWGLSLSSRNKLSLFRSGAVPLLGRIARLGNRHPALLPPVVGTLQECASLDFYRVAIRQEQLLPVIIKHLDKDHVDLTVHCAAVIFKCAEDRESRILVGELGGLEPLVALLADPTFQTGHPRLVEAVTGALWKCALSPDNIRCLQELETLPLLVKLLETQPEEVQVNIVGCLGLCAKDPANCLTIKKSGGVPLLVQLLSRTHVQLVINVARAVAACAQEPECMAIIEELDGLRLLWSQLKSPNPEVQTEAAWAICPCLQNAQDAGHLVRSYVGGLELVVNLLRSDNVRVLAAVCAALVYVARDDENLAVITDYGIVDLLSALDAKGDQALLCYQADAVAACCAWKVNRLAFSGAGVVPRLVRHLRKGNRRVQGAMVRALNQLSHEPINCITMHKCGVVPYLLKMVSSKDREIQEAAASCVCNIRQLSSSLYVG